MGANAGAALGGAGSLLRGGLGRLVSFFGGPWVMGITAATTALYAFSDSESEAEKVARKYGRSLEDINTAYDRLTQKSKAAADSTADLTAKQQAAIDLRYKADRDLLEKRLQELAEKSRGTTQVYNIPGVHEIESFYSGAVGEAQKAFKALWAEVGDGRNVTQGSVEAVQALIDSLKPIKEGGFFDTASRDAKEYSEFLETILVLLKDILVLGNRLNSQPTLPLPASHALMQAENALMQQLGKESEEYFKKTLPGQMEAAKKDVEKWRANFAATGSAMDRANLKHAEDALKRLSGGSRRSGGRKNDAAAAIAQITDEINRLTMSAREYESLKLDQRLGELAGKVPSDLLGQLRSATEEDWLKKDTEKAEEEAKRHLDIQANFWREYADMGGRNREAALRAQETALQAEYKIHQEAVGDIAELHEWLSLKRLSYSQNAVDGAYRYLQDFSNEALNQAKNTTMVIEGFYGGMGRVFSLTTKGMKMDWNSMLDDMLNRAWQAMAINPLMGGLAKGTNSLLDMLGLGGPKIGSFGASAFSTGTGVLGLAKVFGLHEGGIVGRDYSFQRTVPASLFQETFKYHTGGIAGLRPDEIPAILRRDEEVLTRQDPRHRYNNGAGPNIQINVIDQRSANSPPVEVQQSQTAGGGIQIDVLVPALESALSARVANGTSQLARTLDATRGTSPNKQLYSK